MLSMQKTALQAALCLSGMGGKAKPTKHTAKELQQKEPAGQGAGAGPQRTAHSLRDFFFHLSFSFSS